MKGRPRRQLNLALAGIALAGLACPARAYLFWSKPALGGPPVFGGEPGVTLPLPGATPVEQQANLIWTMRAGLNVAALQCQFAPPLRTVENYNNMLKQHGVELQQTYTTLGNYFKRVASKTWQNALDDYTTKTYNSFSTLRAQLIFCETAASIGKETLESPRGQLARIASERMREFRNSLIPVGDMAFAYREVPMQFEPVTDPRCYNKKGKEIRCKNK
jgi:hypothetical protein